MQCTEELSKNFKFSLCLSYDHFKIKVTISKGLKNSNTNDKSNTNNNLVFLCNK